MSHKILHIEKNSGQLTLNAQECPRDWTFQFSLAIAALQSLRCKLIIRRSKLVQIIVRENNVDQALKALKKKMQREGTFREMKRRNHFEKPSEKRAREDAEAVRRTRKLQRKRAQREGLIAIR
jgi:small subunit ribosomal protein S21